jgi:DeoR/GlpR family transcriptional regulator of sugar metabolism
MIKNQRQREILKLLGIKEIVGISALSKKLKCSIMTIHRDLEELETQGLVSKVHGGAMLVKVGRIELPFYERSELQQREKKLIGRKAMALVEKGDIVFFDAGTTTLAVIDYIPSDLAFTAITTALMAASALCHYPLVTTVFVGGNLHHGSLSSADQSSVDKIKSYNADLAFLSTRGLQADRGTFEQYLPLIEVKRAMAEVSKKVVLLADYTKFGRDSLSLAIPIEKIDMVITDGNTSKTFLQDIEKRGIAIIVAD